MISKNKIYLKTYLTIFIFRYTYLFENKLIAIQQLQKMQFQHHW